MPETLATYLSHRTPLELLRDVADIVVVYYLFYRLLLVARGTRAMQIATGLGIVSLMYVVAQAIGLVTIVALFGALLQSIILVIVVVFQTDIRRALERVGSRAFFGNFARTQESEVIESVVLASGELARHRVGAIIAFEQDANLDEFIGQNKGITLDAQVSRELLVSLFLPDASNKLHDGAVILRNLRIAKAGVFFPMPESRVFDPSFGSRHRAAIGITEETDAVVVVVSEERGTISFCFNGNVASNLQAEQLREMLLSIMSPKVRRKSRQLQRRRSSQSVLPPEVEPQGRVQGDEQQAPPPSTARRAISVPPAPLRKVTPAPPAAQTPLPASAHAPIPPAVQTPRAGGVAGTRASDDDTVADASLRQSVSSVARPMPRGQGLELPPDPDDSDDPRSSPT
jgi:diadenylate cyclase